MRGWIRVAALFALSCGCGDAAPHAVQSAPAPAPAPNTDLKWPLHQHRTYDVRLASHYGPKDGQSIFGFELTGTLEVGPVQRDAASVEYLMTLSDTKLAAESLGVATAVGQVATDLQKPYLFYLSEGRLKEEYRMAPGAAPLVASIMRTLSSALQYPQETFSGERNSVEQDATGRYAVVYERPTPEVIRKRKLHYESWNVGATAATNRRSMQLPRVIQSGGEIELHDSAPTRITLDERLETEFSMQSATTLALTQRTPQARAIGQAEVTSARQATVVADRMPLPTSSPDLDRAKLGDRTLSQITERLEANAKTKANAPSQADAKTGFVEPLGGEATDLFIALGAALRIEPKNAQRLESLIRAGSAARPTLISGLGSAGTSEGHTVLLRLMNDEKLPKEVRDACGLSLARTPKPSAVAIAGLQAKLSEPRWSRLAAYALGTFARRVREQGNSAEATRLVALLTSRLAVTHDPSSESDLLSAISNSAAPEILEIARPRLSHPNDDVRSAALTALRLVQHENVDALLVEGLRADKVMYVRLAALRALVTRTPTPLLTQAVSDAASDSYPRIRQEAVMLMQRWLPTHPGLRSALERVARSDESASIRTLAESALGGKSG